MFTWIISFPEPTNELQQVKMQIQNMSLMYNVLILDREWLKLCHPNRIEMIANEPELWKFLSWFSENSLALDIYHKHAAAVFLKLLIRKWLNREKCSCLHICPWENSGFKSLLQNPEQIELSPWDNILCVTLASNPTLVQWQSPLSPLFDFPQLVGQKTEWRWKECYFVSLTTELEWKAGL